MVGEGFEHREPGVRAFTETYGLLEKITVIEPADNACSDGRETKRLRRRPGASPLLFGRFLMSLGAFVSLEDISDALPPYREEVVSVEMDLPLKEAYRKLEDGLKKALREHRGNQSVISVALNTLLAYPDRPFGFGNPVGREYNPETLRREPFLIAETEDLDQEQVYAKEQRLVEEVKAELRRGRRCQIYAVYTQKRDVTHRLERILTKEGLRVAVLRTEVPPEQREAWYERQLRVGVQAVICHPRLVQTGLDLLEFPTILFYETGYSTYTLRQASRRSWRIGQDRDVTVKFLEYAGTMQETCLRLMGRKLLVSLAMEGKFYGEGLQAMDEGEDILMAMARELVTEKGIGENAAAVWKRLQQEQQEVFGVRVTVEPNREPESLVDAAPRRRGFAASDRSGGGPTVDVRHVAGGREATEGLTSAECRGDVRPVVVVLKKAETEVWRGRQGFFHRNLAAGGSSDLPGARKREGASPEAQRRLISSLGAERPHGGTRCQGLGQPTGRCGIVRARRHREGTWDRGALQRAATAHRATDPPMRGRGVSGSRFLSSLAPQSRGDVCGTQELCGVRGQRAHSSISAVCPR